MPRFGRTSRKRLETCEEALQVLMNQVIKDFDCSIVVGHRNKEAQEKAFKDGNSKKRWGESKHNSYPSRAVDVCPYPIDWDDRDRFHFFAGFVMSVAIQLGINIRWGGNWANDFDKGFKKNKFDDMVHFELI
tara:strand:- start:702 stop:1097 length:396 start_codon:yes stop_codon:yes gene_type:complete